ENASVRFGKRSDSRSQFNFRQQSSGAGRMASPLMMRRSFFLALVLTMVLSSLTRADSLLYNGALNTTPDAQGWFFGADSILAAQSAGGGATTFSTTAGDAIRAGYSTQNPIT